MPRTTQTAEDKPRRSSDEINLHLHSREDHCSHPLVAERCRSLLSAHLPGVAAVVVSTRLFYGVMVIKWGCLHVVWC